MTLNMDEFYDQLVEIQRRAKDLAHKLRQEVQRHVPN